MDNDEIVFGDVSYREPQRRRRPDLDGQWACIAYELPQPDDLPIYLNLATADAIERHALRDTSVELGGILLGEECIDEVTGRPFVWVTQSLEAKHYENTQSSFTYTHESWEEITRERDRQFPDLHIVGWYHTHPDFGIFLSSHDQFIHRHFFSQLLQVAYVVDPIRQTRGFFQWRGEHLDQVGGYYITAQRGERLALARFVNDLENIPSAPSAGGGLSPRLEAELIAMLTRPTYPPAMVDRGQSAAVFTLMGALVGVLGMAAVLWLSSLGARVQEQTDSLKTLAAALEKSEAEHRESLDAAQIRAREDALNTLLHDVNAGTSSEGFATRFATVSRERDEARRELNKLKVTNDSIYEADQRLRSELSAAQKEAESLKNQGKELARVQDENARLKAFLEERDLQIADKAVFRKYDIAWYAALAGWVVSFFLVLALVANTGRPLRTDPPEPETPPHTIL